MANRQGIYSSKRKAEVKPKYFVKEAQHHPNGFTVYKVICREPDPNSFDCFRESFVWKRYSDFKDLYKCLVTLHRKLYLNGRPPDFAKPKLFGRFEESVVNERKQSAEDVLNFATEHPPLCKSAVFKEFFRALQPIDSSIEIKYLKQTPLKPSKDKRKSSTETEETSDEPHNSAAGLSEADLEVFDPFLSTKEFIASTSTNQDENWIEEIKRNFTPNRTVVNLSDAPDAEEDLALLEDLKVSVTQTDLETYYGRNKENTSPKATENCEKLVEKDEMKSIMETEDIVNKHVDVERLDTDGDARKQHRKSSKASAYLESVIRRNRLQSENENFDSKSKEKHEQFNNISPPSTTATTKLPTPKLGTSPTNNGSSATSERSFFGITTRSSLLDLPKMLRDDNSDDESRGAYVTQAAQQISFARAAENKLAYEEAFGHYKAAINTLLQGVQGDTNEARIQAVRRKTANYLKRAEDIHSCHLKTTLTDSDLWKPDNENKRSASPRPPLQPINTQRARRNTASPTPVVPSPRHNSKDLACYKVLGTVGKVQLVLDTRSNETYVLKILVKSCQNRLRKGVIPTNVPFMVRLHRYYSTDHAVCLLLEHATGGRLWDHLASYFEISRTKNDPPKPVELAGMLPKHLKMGMSSTPKKQHPVVEEEVSTSVQEEEEDEQCSTSFLDLCMEYKTLEGGKPVVTTDGATEAKEIKVSDNVAENKQNPAYERSPVHRSISDAIEDPSLRTEEVNVNLEKPEPAHQNPAEKKLPQEHVPIKRSWSYLSWDDGLAVQPEPAIDAPSSATGTVNNAMDDKTQDLQYELEEKTSFKAIASQGDLALFTIGQETDSEPISSAADRGVVEDPLEDSIYDSRSNEASEGDDSGDDHPDPFKHELLSEQDMSAVSLLGENMEKTLQARLASEGALVPGGSPVLARVAGTLRGSPCLSMNSSFEEENAAAEKIDDCDPGQLSPPAITRVVDENGVSSVDAVSLFRTHSRTRSTASISETKSLGHVDVLEKTDEVDGIEKKESQVNGNENKFHSIFVDMDAAKERSLSYKIPESTIRKWSAEVVVAVGTLHSIGILCRDLNPNNILLSSDSHIRLSYFGKWRQVERKPCDKVAVEQMYAAPEMNRVGEKKTEACDWWSVGALLYELMTGQALYLAHPSGVSSHTVLSLPDHLSAEAKSLLSGLLQYHPTQRLGYGMKGLDDLMDHPFFNGIEWDFLIENYVAS